MSAVLIAQLKRCTVNKMISSCFFTNTFLLFFNSAMMESGAEPSLSSKLTKLMFFPLKTGHSFIVQWEENSLVSKLDKFVTDDKD